MSPLVFDLLQVAEAPSSIAFHISKIAKNADELALRNEAGRQDIGQTTQHNKHLDEVAFANAIDKLIRAANRVPAKVGETGLNCFPHKDINGNERNFF